MPVSDTSSSAARFLMEANRALSPTQRLERVVALNQALDAIVEAAIRARHPDLTDREIRDHVACRHLGTELFAKVVAERERRKSADDDRE